MRLGRWNDMPTPTCICWTSFKTESSAGGTYGRQAETGRFVSFLYGERGRRIGSGSLLESMDNAKVEHALVSGMPFLKKWSQNEPFMRPHYYLDSSSRVKPARDGDVSVGAAIADYRRKSRQTRPTAPNSPFPLRF